MIGRFDDNGEPVWFDVETNKWKDENGNWKMDNEADLDKAIGGYAATRGERMR